jgi:hypothetical protein
MAKARKQDFIVELIGTLSANEKRYFKLFCNVQPGEKRYLKLFDALEGIKKYNSTELCGLLGITPKQLTDDKAYLLQALLQSLRNYGVDNREVSILRNNRENAYLLFVRHMFDFALDVINKTLVRAQQLEAFELIDDLLFLKGRCLAHAPLVKVNEHKQLVDDYNSNHGKQREMVTLLQIYNSALRFTYEANRGPGFKKLMVHPLIKDKPGKLKSLRAQGMWFNIWRLYYTEKKDVNALVRREYALYKKRPDIKRIAPNAYLSCLLGLWEAAENPTEALAILEETEMVLNKGGLGFNEQVESGHRFYVLWRKTQTLRILGRNKEGIDLCNSLYAPVAAFGEYEYITLLFEHGLMLLHSGDAGNAAEKIKAVLDMNSSMRPDMQTLARLVYILTTLELENFAVINPLIRSTKLWIKKSKADNLEADLLLKHAGAIARMPTSRMAIYRQLCADVKASLLENIDRSIHLGRWLTRITAR